MTTLRFLDVGHSRVNDDFFEALANLDRLEHFSFGGNKMSGVALPLLKLLPSLRELSVAAHLQHGRSWGWVCCALPPHSSCSSRSSPKWDRRARR
jgi:hypothetical protein